MTATTVSGNATPTTTQGADAATTETASSLAALMGFGELAKESTSPESADADTEQNSQPEAGQVAVLSQLETASDGATSDSPATEETETEASAEETAQSDGEKTDDELVEGLPRRARKRIDTLTARNKALEADKATLEAELATLRAKQPEVTAQTNASAPVVIDNRLEQVTDLRELETVEAKSRDRHDLGVRVGKLVNALREKLRGDPDLDIPGDLDSVHAELKRRGYEVEYDRKAVATQLMQIKMAAEEAVEDTAPVLEAAPKRRERLKLEAQAYEAAAADYPWLKSRQGDDWKLFEHVVKNRPEVKLLGPDWPAIVAVQIEGHKSLIARRAAKAKAAPVAAKAAAEPPKQPSRSATPRPAANSAARSRFEQSASEQDLAALMPG